MCLLLRSLLLYVLLYYTMCVHGSVFCARDRMCVFVRVHAGCIVRNFGRDTLQVVIAQEQWHCFICQGELVLRDNQDEPHVDERNEAESLLSPAPLTGTDDVASASRVAAPALVHIKTEKDDECSALPNPVSDAAHLAAELWAQSAVPACVRTPYSSIPNVVSAQ